MNISQAFKPRTPEPVLCNGYELAYVLAGIRARGGFVNGIEAGVGGKNAMYSVSYFNRRVEELETHREKASPDALAETKRVIPDVIAASEQAARSIAGSNPVAPAISESIESRLNALQLKLAASGKLKRSKPTTKTHHARLPHNDSQRSSLENLALRNSQQTWY